MQIAMKEGWPTVLPLPIWSFHVQAEEKLQDDCVLIVQSCCEWWLTRASAGEAVTIDRTALCLAGASRSQMHCACRYSTLLVGLGEARCRLLKSRPGERNGAAATRRSNP